MQMTVKQTAIAGCFELIPNMIGDHRGSFTKTFHAETFSKNGLCTDWREEYFSVSKQGVLRGLHFQTPPHEHTKLVYCVEGTVLDAVVDLRQDSPSYKKHHILELSADTANMLYIPSGLAHGFYVLSDSATMMYKVSTVYSPQHDTGILWNSAGIAWPDETPIVSERDAGLPALCDLQSPFFQKGSLA